MNEIKRRKIKMKIPDYLKDITNYVKDNNNSLILSLKYTCGKNKFSILVNKNNPEFSKKE